MNAERANAIRAKIEAFRQTAESAERELHATKQEFSDFRQRVSDDVNACLQRNPTMDHTGVARYIIPAPKPDPLVDVLLEMELSSDLEEGQHDAKYLRAKLDARGFEIREKNDG